MRKSTSAIRTAPGNEERTKTPTVCCVNTCRREPIFPATRNPNWTGSRCVSINAREKLWDSRLQQVNCAQVLRRPSEPARQARSYRLYYPVVRQGHRLRTLGPEAQFVDGVLRIEAILLHPTRCGPASHATARRTCPIIKKSETADGFVATPSTRTGPGRELLVISGLNRRSLPGPSRA